jgi:hypothetical protein
MKTAIMKRIFATLTCIFVLAFAASTAHSASGSAGKEFYFAFTPNFNVYPASINLYITGPQDTAGTVEVAGVGISQTFTVKANAITTVTLPKSIYLHPQDQISNLTVHITAQNEVTVFGMNYEQYTSDGFLAIPVEALGQEYYALGYFSGDPDYPSQMIISAPYDNTQVTIVPAKDMPSHPAGVPFTITLNHGDSYYLTSVSDVSGTHIKATAPIAVVAGARCVNIPNSYFTCNYVVEMMPPVVTWGKSFLSVPFPFRLNGDVFRILASENDTKVLINGELKATLNQGQFLETVLTSRSEITSSAPVLVAQYQTGGGFDHYPNVDPSMMLLAPTAQYLSQYAFPAPDFGQAATWVSVVAPTGEIGNLLLDGVPLDTSKFSQIGSGNFSGGPLHVDPGGHTLVSTSNVPFAASVYWYYSPADAYSFPAGMAFNKINPVGDSYPPNVRLITVSGTIQGTATDSEDVNANGVLDPGEDLNGNGTIDRRSEDVNGNGVLDAGEDLNGNGILDRDTGIFKVQLLPDASNLQLNVLPFVPGALAVQFTISRIDPTKPGTGTLHIEDGAGNVKETPISIAATAVLKNVRVVETLATNGLDIDMSSFATQPVSITDDSGKKIIEWRFDTFTADSAGNLGFDVMLRNPIPGEKRLVSYKLDLYYNDANGQPVHTALDSLSVNVFPANFVVTPTLDKATYAANDVVQITTNVTNLSSFPNAVGVKLSIKDTSNVLVSTLGTIPSQTIAANGVAAFSGLNFVTGNIYAGGYQVVAEVVDAGGVVLAVGYAPFSILSPNGPTVTTAITTDKQAYLPTETVKISDRLTNVTANTLLNNLSVVTILLNPDGTVRYTASATLPQLGVGTLKDYSYNVPLIAAVPGRYTVNLNVSANAGMPISQATTTFTVASSADTGSGLTGSITASPKQVPQGNPVALAYSVSNLGNSTIANLPLKVRIVDPAAQKVMVEFPASQTLAIGTPYQAGVSWTTSGVVGTTYVAVLTATVNGKTLTLAQDSFVLTAPPTKLDVKQTINNNNRVLVLVSCNDGENDANNKDGSAPTCQTQRTQAIDQALSSLGVTHLITSTENDFKQAFRSGIYNTYWISGKVDKLHDTTASEIAEAVFAGDGAIIDGVHDQRNKTLDAMAGASWKGKIGEVNLTASITGSQFVSQNIPTVGRSARMDLSGATQQAVLLGATQTGSYGPAISINNYGAGHVTTYAFDLPLSLQAQNRWQSELGANLQFVLPTQPLILTPGAILSMQTSVTNQAQAVSVDIKTTLPADVAYLGSSPTGAFTANTNSIDWIFNLGASQTYNANLTVRAPSTAGDSAIQTVMSTTLNGATSQYGNTISLPATVIAAAKTSGDAIAALKMLNLTQTKDKNLRDALVSQMQSAMSSFQLNTAIGYDAAIGQWIAVVGQLSTLNNVDTRSVHDALDRLIKEAEWRWSALAPSSNTGIGH